MDPRGPPDRRHAPVTLMRSDLIHSSRLSLPHTHECRPYLIMTFSISSVSSIVDRKNKGIAAEVQQGQVGDALSHHAPGEGSRQL